MFYHEVREGKLVVELDLYGVEEGKCHWCGHAIQTGNVLYYPDQLRQLGMIIREYCPKTMTDGEIINQFTRFAGGIH